MGFITRNVPAFAGLGAGVLGGVLAILLGVVIFTGEGLGSDGEPPVQVYTNF
ncbi:MAG: hypothetical protein AAFP13_15315 [Pseudomonadota bacterium]